MLVRYITIITILVSGMILRYVDIVRLFPGLIRGKVADARTGKPLDKVHVFIVSGEEEDFTDEHGEFSLRTTKPYPVRIHAEKRGYIGGATDCLADKQHIQIHLQPDK